MSVSGVIVAFGGLIFSVVLIWTISDFWREARQDRKRRRAARNGRSRAWTYYPDEKSGGSYQVGQYGYGLYESHRNYGNDLWDRGGNSGDGGGDGGGD